MPFSISYPFINGHQYSFSSIEFAAGVSITRGIKSVDYGDKLSPGKYRGSGPNIIGRTRGEYEADGSLEIYRPEWENIKATLGTGGYGFGESAFPITVAYGDVGAPVITDVLEGCRVIECRTGGQEGPDAITVKITLDIMRILHNGVPMYSASLGG